MKHLRIESNRGQFSLDGIEWKEIDRLGRDELLQLIDLAVGEDFQIDSFDMSLLPNPAHQIVYKHLSERLHELSENRARFRDDSAAIYKDAIQKYSVD